MPPGFEGSLYPAGATQARHPHTHTSLTGAATGKWNVSYLQAGLAGLPCTVYSSPTRHFQYWDADKNEAGYPLLQHERMAKLTMTVDEFIARLNDSVDNANASCQAGAPEQGWRYYLQTVLVDGVSSAMTDDFRGFDWGSLLAIQQRLGWGELSSNLLLIGQKSNVTPTHYDEQQNLFAQLHGTKRVIMFPPQDVACLYPLPVHNPCDRQSQVDLYNPDLDRFPKFAQAQPLEARLNPGDVLYIPQYWWHHIENLSDECISLNFWFKDQSKPQELILPLSPSQHLAMRRNVEKIVADILGAREAQRALPLLASDSPPEVLQPVHTKVMELLAHVMKVEQIHPWLGELADGRFNIDL